MLKIASEITGNPLVVFILSGINEQDVLCLKIVCCTGMFVSLVSTPLLTTSFIRLSAMNVPTRSNSFACCDVQVTHRSRVNDQKWFRRLQGSMLSIVCLHDSLGARGAGPLRTLLIQELFAHFQATTKLGRRDPRLAATSITYLMKRLALRRNFPKTKGVSKWTISCKVEKREA